MDKTKDLSAFELSMVVAARRTSVCQELHRCWVFHAQQFPVCIKNGTPPEGHPANLTTVGSIGVNMGQHPCGTFSTPCRVHALTNGGCSEGKRGVF
jgi:hypothetical protein